MILFSSRRKSYQDSLFINQILFFLICKSFNTSASKDFVLVLLFWHLLTSSLLFGSEVIRSYPWFLNSEGHCYFHCPILLSPPPWLMKFPNNPPPPYDWVRLKSDESIKIGGLQPNSVSLISCNQLSHQNWRIAADSGGWIRQQSADFDGFG